jgi:hypothetical protein
VHPLAVSNVVGVAYGLGLMTLLVIAPSTVTALKRHWLLFAAGWLTVGGVWWIAALRLARPDSWWARRFYGPEKLARAEARYGPASDATPG